MKVGDVIFFPGPGDEVIWYDGPLSFFNEFEDGIYYFHEAGVTNGLYEYYVEKTTTENKLALLNNQMDFYSFFRNPKMISVRGDIIVEIREPDELDLGSLPNRGIFWSK